MEEIIKEPANKLEQINIVENLIPENDTEPIESERPSTSTESQPNDNRNDETANNICEKITKTIDASNISLETKIGGILCIFYTKSPFSDFTTSSFILDGKFYHSVEHYFQIQMCYAFGLFKLAHCVIQIADVHEFRKKLRTELKAMIKTGLFEARTFSKWKDINAVRIMKKGNRSKFDQNHKLRDLLLHTGDRLLCFAAKNDVRLGIGMTETEFLFWTRKNRLTESELLNFFSGVAKRPRELGWNGLGNVLMEIRAEYMQKQSILTQWKNAHPDKCKASLERKTVPLTDDEINQLKGIQGDMELCADQVTKEKPKGFRSAPTPVTSSVIRINQCLSGAKVDGHGRQLPANATKVEHSAKMEAAQKIEPVQIEILSEEKRILVKRKDVETKVIGSVDDKLQVKIKKSRWTEPDENTNNVEPTEMQRNVLERLNSFKFEKPMINPYTVVPSSTSDDDEGLEHLQEGNRDETGKNEQQPAIVWPPAGTPYTIEQGEIPPDGVIVPPPGVAGPAYLLPLSHRDWIVRPQYPARGRAAALPPHLLPPLPCPPGVDHLVWQQRFPHPNDGDITRNRLFNQMPYFGVRPPLIFAPDIDPVDKKRVEWKVPANPLASTMDMARNFIRIILEKLNQPQANRPDEEEEEGTSPAFKKPKVEEPASIPDPVAFCREIFPFGMEVSLPDLFDLGFIPPPIIGDPEAQRRNKPLTVTDWLSQFDDPFEALRFFASRWIKKGRLSTTGEYESIKIDQQQEIADIFETIALDLDKDDEKYRRSIDTERACRPDDEQADDFDPELMNDSFAPERLYSNNYGDYWALSRWKWAQWERKLSRGDDAKWLDVQQETIEDAVCMTGKPMAYTKGEENAEKPDASGQKLNENDAKSNENNESNESADELCLKEIPKNESIPENSVTTVLID